MPRLFRTIVPLPALALAACLVLAAAEGAPLHAAEMPGEDARVESPPGEETPPQVESTNQEKVEGAGKAVEQAHAYLQRSILERVVWFDEFFGNVKTEDARQPEYLLRWRNSVRWEEGGNFIYRTSVRASLRLPKISDRLHLVVSGENEAEPSPGLPDDPGNPGFDRTLANTRLVNTELRYGLIRRPAIDLFLGAGIRVTLPVESFVRGRFQYTHRLGESSLARFAETVFWKNEDGLGETTEITLER
ncbi:MAG TPA: hypothetical protein VH660_03635, partial [Candidatus Deferrimicrobiaceae bacterium]